MTNELHKVVWAEGVVLGQQHFQAWDRYLHEFQRMMAAATSPYGWGLVSLSVDEEALASGVYRVSQCEAIFNSGVAVSFETQADQQLAATLEEADGPRVPIFLALAVNPGINGISGYSDGGQLCAWRAEYRAIADDYDGGRSREVLLARPNLQLFKGAAPGEQFLSIQIAEVESVGNGAYALVPTFMPASCRIKASGEMLGIVQRLAELFLSKARLLAERVQQYGSRIADYGPNELSSFLLLQSLNPAAARLRHLRDTPELHPEALYRALLDITAVLAAYSHETNIGDIVAYDHRNPSVVFNSLDRTLRTLIDAVMPSRAAGVTLSRETELIYSADSIELALLENASFFLAVSLETDNTTWFTDFPLKVKVGPRKDIEMIMASALPGASLTHTQRPPNRLPIKSGYEYFRIEPRGDFWERIVEARSIALFLTRDYAQVRMELLTVDE